MHFISHFQRTLTKCKPIAFDLNGIVQSEDCLMLRSIKVHLSLCRSILSEAVPVIKDVFLQEIMTLSGSAFEDETVDVDSIKFACKHSLQRFYFSTLFLQNKSRCRSA